MLQVLSILGGGLLSILSAMAAGRLIARQTALPHCVRFVTGAALLSVGIFALLACHLGYPIVYLAGGALLAAAAWRSVATTPRLPSLPWWYRALFAGYGLMYLLVAMAPEIQEDAAGYHLRIVSDYARLHAFSGRITFYDVLPHGMEMLFVPAFALGAHSAAKLVHFAFLIATVPLIRHMARALGIGDNAGCAAAALFFMAPVCGVDGTSAYTDIGLVCACACVLYLLLRCRSEPSGVLLACAGLNAGFCYAVKPTFGWVAIVAVVYVAVELRRLRTVAVFGLLAAAVALPWVFRAWILTGDPFAPFVTAWLPNASSTPALEQRLIQMYGAFRPTFSWRSALPDYTILGGNQGLLGPAFLLLPAALLALRGKAGRWLLASSFLLAIPFLANTGTRFLMPPLLPASIALASILPSPALLALVTVQAFGSAPSVLDLYQKRPDWRIRDIPVRAALRMEPEQTYLNRTILGFPLTTLLETNTASGSQIFVCTTVAESYVHRSLLFYWQSALAAHITDALHLAAISHSSPAQLLSLRSRDRKYRTVRMTALSELRLIGASASSPSWRLYGPGESLSLNGSKGADFLIWPAGSAREATDTMSDSGAWVSAESLIERSTLNIDIRRDVTAWIRRAGYHYILMPLADSAFANVGMDMARHPAEWGVSEVERSGNCWLFHISPELL